jgi:tetratricopeptide (TPR) repeat protein
MKPAILLAAIVTLPLVLSAQSPAAKFVDSARTAIDAAVAITDTGRLAGAVVLLDRALIAYPDDPYLLHYRGYAAYRQAIGLYHSGRLGAAAPYIDRAIADLQASSAKLQWPETYSLLATVIGLSLALDPSQGMTLGPRMGELSARAAQLGPNNPRVLYLAAVAAFNTPAEYGGSVETARTLIMRSLEAFKTEKPAPLAPSWGLSDATEFARLIHALPPAFVP